MKNQPLIFERILRGNLRPWLDCKDYEEKFARIIKDLKPIENGFKPLYEIDFNRCFNCKTKFYQKLIIMEADHYCNKVIELINAQGEIRVKKYLLTGRLKKVKILLGESARLIDAHCYELQSIDQFKSDFDEGSEHKADTYVIQLLKTALLKVYLEIQEVFKYYILREDYMEIEDLYLQVLSEPIPEKTFLKLQEITNVADSNLNEKVLKYKLISFKFDRLETNPGALIDLFDCFKLHHFIENCCTVRDFKKAFSGVVIDHPIRWIGNQSEFYWFIHLLYTKYKFVDDVKQQQWKIAGYCFVQADGTRFDMAKVRNLKKPKSTGALIEMAVKMLK